MSAAGLCSRCKRPAPRGLWDPGAPADDPSFDAPDFVEWEAYENGQLVCPGCLTREEQIEMLDPPEGVE